MASKEDAVFDSWEQFDENEVLDKNFSKILNTSIKIKDSNDTENSSESPVNIVLVGDDALRSQYVAPKPTVTILKRPNGTPQQMNGDAKPKFQLKTLEQRESEYAEARLRILGKDSSQIDALPVQQLHRNGKQQYQQQHQKLSNGNNSVVSVNSNGLEHSNYHHHNYFDESNSVRLAKQNSNMKYSAYRQNHKNSQLITPILPGQQTHHQNVDRDKKLQSNANSFPAVMIPSQTYHNLTYPPPVHHPNYYQPQQPQQPYQHPKDIHYATTSQEVHYTTAARLPPPPPPPPHMQFKGSDVSVPIPVPVQYHHTHPHHPHSHHHPQQQVYNYPTAAPIPYTHLNYQPTPIIHHLPQQPPPPPPPPPPQQQLQLQHVDNIINSNVVNSGLMNVNNQNQQNQQHQLNAAQKNLVVRLPRGPDGTKGFHLRR